MGKNAALNEQLHTAEHIFARCLQNAGADIHVRKVDTERADGLGEAFLKEAVPIERIIIAEREANDVIAKGLDVSVRVFKNIEEARSVFPKIRFNQDRLSDSQGIRAVNIGDFDWAACAMNHVRNTSDIMAFSVVGATYPAGETKITFRAGADAVAHMLRVKAAALAAASRDNFDAEMIGERYTALREEADRMRYDAESALKAAISSSDRAVLYVKARSINILYGPMADYLKRYADRYLIVFNDTQLLGAKGANCAFDIEGSGRQLKSAGAFLGAIKPDSISGKVVDIKKVKEHFRLMESK